MIHFMPDGTIPEGVAETLREAERRGVGIVIATGRSYPSAKIYAEILGSECPVICYNGAAFAGRDKAAAVLCESERRTDEKGSRFFCGSRTLSSDVR